jgi:hypothetical protein
MAEEGISLLRTPKIKAMPRFWRGGPLQNLLPAPEGVVPKKPKALIQVCFSGQTVEVGANVRFRTDGPPAPCSGFPLRRSVPTSGRPEAMETSHSCRITRLARQRCAIPMDGTMHDRPAAPEQGCNRADALPLFVVQPRGLGALVRA